MRNLPKSKLIHPIDMTMVMKKNRFILSPILLLLCYTQGEMHAQTQGGTQAQFQVGSMFVEFQTANSFKEGYASVSIKRANEPISKFGYINKEGKKAIDFQFDEVKDFSERLAAVRIGVHWGYIDMSGIYIIPSQFDEVYSFSEGVACVGIGPAKSRKYGYIDKNGKYIINPQFDEPDRFANGFLIFQHRSQEKSKTVVKYGYRYIGGNKEKKDFPAIYYDEAYLFTEDGLARVKKGTTYSYINNNLTEVTKPISETERIPDDSENQAIKFAEASDFSEGLAYVKYDKSSWGSETAGISGNSENQTIEFDKYSYIDTEGNRVKDDNSVEPQFDFADNFLHGLARIGKKEAGNSTIKYGYIDTKGNIVVEPQFDFADDFSASGLARINIGGVQQRVYGTVKGGRYGYINKEGKIVINPQFILAKDFSEELAYVMMVGTPLKRGYISADYSGEFAIELELSLVYEFSTENPSSTGDLALIELNQNGKKKYGYIDRSGKIIISPTFDFADDFSYGLARIGNGDKGNRKYGYIDKTGNSVIEPQFNNAGDFFQLLQGINTHRLDNFPPLARVEIDGQVSYINKKGDIINPDNTQSSSKRK